MWHALTLTLTLTWRSFLNALALSISILFIAIGKWSFYRLTASVKDMTSNIAGS